MISQGKNNSARLISLSLVGACIGIIGIGDALAQAKPDIRIGTGRQGGAYYRLGAVIADTLVRSGKVKSATAESASGAIETSRLVDKGTLQISGMDKTWVIRAMNAVKPYKKKIVLRTVIPMGNWPLFFVTKVGSKVISLDDLKGKRVAFGARGSGMEQHAIKLLKGIGLSVKDVRPVYLSFGPGSRALKDGKADAQLQCCIPNGAMTQLSELSKVRVVNMDKHLDKLLRFGQTYGRTVMKKGAFKGHDKDIAALSIIQGWMASPKLPDETAYIFASTVLKNIDEMAKKMPQFNSIKPMLAAAKAKNNTKPVEIGAPMHPGAVRALKEAGILK